MTEEFDIAAYWRDRCAGNLESDEITPADRANCPGIPVNMFYAHVSNRDCTEIEYTFNEIDSTACEACDARVLAEDCAQVHRRNSRGTIVSETWCESCREEYTFYCERTNEYVHNDYGVTVNTIIDGRHNDAFICAAWYAEDHYYCYESDGNWYSEPEDDNENSSGLEDDENDNDGLFPYGTNVLSKHPWPANAPKSALLFGVELEIEGNDNTSREQLAIVAALGGNTGADLKDGAYILAADGSLNTGVEIITVPQTFEAHKAETVVPWKKISAAIRGIAKSGNTKTCGMHVHINRAALTPLQTGKMLVFLNANSMTRLVERVAQRSTEQWAKRAPKAFADGLPHRVTEFGHYDALGYSSKGTMELRIFRGNTRHDRIMKNLEFTHAMCEFARLESMQDMDQPNKFLAFIGAREKTYPNLCKFLDAHCEDNANASEDV